MRLTGNRHLLTSTASVAAIFAWSAPAHAQLLTLFDVINALVQLDSQVTLQGQVIGSLQGTVDASLLDIASLQGNVSVLQAASITLNAQVSTLGVNDALQDTALSQVQAGLGANVAIDAQQTSDLASLQASLTANVGVDAGQDLAIGGLDTRLTAAAALGVQQGADIAGLQAGLTANSTIDAQQSGDIVSLQAGLAANVGIDAQLTGDVAALQTGLAANAAVDIGQDIAIGGLDTRLTVNEVLDVQQGSDIAGLQAGLAVNDLRDDGQDASISGLQTGLAANGAVDAGQTAAIAGLQTGLATNTARDDVQDGRLDYHDVLLADHDARITLAQGSADNALAAVGQLRSDVDTGRAGMVRVDTLGSLAVGGGLGGSTVSFAGTAGDRRLTGIADGIAPNDAATVGQMTTANAAVLASANAYTDTSLTSLTGDIDRLFVALSAQNKDLRSELDAAAAGAAALAGMPQAFVPGRGMVSVGVGGRGGEMAVAFGFGKAFDAPHTPVIRAGAAIDSKRGQVTYNAGVGFHF